MISQDRKGHIWGVAELMKKYAEENGRSSEDVEDYYMLGLLHDVGYEFAEPEHYIEHNKIGGGILKRLGYKHWKEVYYHGEVDPEYDSELLDILNWADMHIDSTGNYVTFQGRLEEISQRYHVPVDETDSKPVVDWLISKGFK